MRAARVAFPQEKTGAPQNIALLTDCYSTPSHLRGPGLDVYVTFNSRPRFIAFLPDALTRLPRRAKSDFHVTHRGLQDGSFSCADMQTTPKPALLDACVAAYLQWMTIQNYAARSIEERRKILGYFTGWCRSVGVSEVNQVERRTFEAWQIHLHEHQKSTGGALSIGVQHNRLVQVQAFFRWLVKKDYLGSNPSSDLELPKLPLRLPLSILSPQEVESILRKPDISAPCGLRDKALLELLYSTGIRRKEAVELALDSIDWSRSVLKVRQGKGGKDRVIPVGQRALHWLRRYLDEGRAALNPLESCFLFVTNHGQRFNLNGLGNLVHRYVAPARLGGAGSCHVLRHAMATAMLDHGADIRFVQEMLGHQRLETTQLYTHVSIEKLKSVHRATHPVEQGSNSDRLASVGMSVITAPEIATLRGGLGMDLRAFARLLNLSVRALTRLESGRSQAGGPLLRLLQILRANPRLGPAIHATLTPS